MCVTYRSESTGSHTQTPDCCRLSCQSCRRSSWWGLVGIHLVRCTCVKIPPTISDSAWVIPSRVPSFVKPFFSSFDVATPKRRNVIFQLQCDTFGWEFFPTANKSRINWSGVYFYKKLFFQTHCQQFSNYSLVLFQFYKMIDLKLSGWYSMWK